MEVELVPLRVRQHASGSFYANISVVIVAVVAALLTQQPATIALGAPSLVVCLAGLVMAQREEIEVTARFDRPSGIEGDELTLTVNAVPARGVPMLDIEVVVPANLAVTNSTRVLRAVRGGETSSIDFGVTLTEWGLSSPEAIVVSSRDNWGMIMTRQVMRCDCRLRTYLPDPATRSLLSPQRFLRLVGNHTSNDIGGGCELADIRPYRNGDRVRDINWRISARHDEPWVNERHPDRAATVMILVDATADAGAGQGMLLRRSVRAAMAITQSHLQVNDRVGLGISGLKRRWLDPQVGRRHAERISAALLEIRSDEADGEAIDLERQVPRDAIVIAVSPLINEGFVWPLEALSARGQLVHVIQPEIEVVDGLLSARQAVDRDYAYRLFEIERELQRRRLRGRGLSIVQWRLDQPLEVVLESLERWRHSRSVGARR